MATPSRALALEPGTDRHLVRLEEGNEVTGRAVLLSTGADYRRLPVADLDLYEGISVFYKDAGGGVYHTYSSYARGLDTLVGTYNFLDLAPRGRDEEALPWTMAWVRRHDEYEAAAQSCCHAAKS